MPEGSEISTVGADAEVRDAAAQDAADALDRGAQPPSELESLLLSVALFVGLVLFAVGCTVFRWFG